jgi:hypothetical protein
MGALACSYGQHELIGLELTDKLVRERNWGLVSPDPDAGQLDALRLLRRHARPPFLVCSEALMRLANPR